MKFGMSFLLNAVLAYILTLFLPWWSVVVISFVIGLAINMKAWQAFLAGFVSMTALWSGLAGYFDIENASILSQKVANLFQLPASFYLIFLTGFIGGLLGGMGCLTGNLFRDVIFPGKSRYGTRRSKKRYSLPIGDE